MLVGVGDDRVGAVAADIGVEVAVAATPASARCGTEDGVKVRRRPNVDGSPRAKPISPAFSRGSERPAPAPSCPRPSPYTTGASPSETMLVHLNALEMTEGYMLL
jgi:hypothetical protein